MVVAAVCFNEAATQWLCALCPCSAVMCVRLCVWWRVWGVWTELAPCGFGWVLMAESSSCRASGHTILQGKSEGVWNESRSRAPRTDALRAARRAAQGVHTAPHLINELKQNTVVFVMLITSFTLFPWVHTVAHPARCLGPADL